MLISLALNISVRVETGRYNGAASVYLGPVLFGVHPRETFTTMAHWAFDSNDYNVTNATAWNYGLVLTGINEKLPNYGMTILSRDGGPSPLLPFSTEDPPLLLLADVAAVPHWGVESNAAAPPPQSPLGVPPTPIKRIPLYPYGATRLRIAELPYF